MSILSEIDFSMSLDLRISDTQRYKKKEKFQEKPQNLPQLEFDIKFFI
jgi:hypothetical protein